MTSNCVIGLDVSTSCTGICILNEYKLTVYLAAIDLSKCTSFIDKCSKLQQSLFDLKEQFNVSQIFIEQDLQSFRPGLSSAHTLNTLSRFNGAASLMCFQVFNVRPILLNVTNARAAVGIKINYKDKSKKTKEKVWDWVSSQVQMDWPRKKTGSLKPSAFDMSDSYVIALAGILDCKDAQIC